MDPANYREALREAAADEAEGADIMMVKPGAQPAAATARGRPALCFAAPRCKRPRQQCTADHRAHAIWPLSAVAALACHTSLARAACRAALAPCLSPLHRAPGMPYLDVVRALRDSTSLPISVYHVSGEYAMLKAAAERGWLNEKDAALEALMCFRRCGAGARLSKHTAAACCVPWGQGAQQQPLLQGSLKCSRRRCRMRRAPCCCCMSVLLQGGRRPHPHVLLGAGGQVAGRREVSVAVRSVCVLRGAGWVQEGASASSMQCAGVQHAVCWCAAS